LSGGYLGFAPWIAPGGTSSSTTSSRGHGGGEAPWRCYLSAKESGDFAEDEASSCGSLAVLVRRAGRDRRGRRAAGKASKASNAAALE